MNSKKTYVNLYCYFIALFVVIIMINSCNSEEIDVDNSFPLSMYDVTKTRSLSEVCELKFDDGSTDLETSMEFSLYCDLDIFFDGKKDRKLVEIVLYFKDQSINKDWKIKDISPSDFTMDEDSIWNYLVSDFSIYKGGVYEIWAEITYKIGNNSKNMTTAPIYYTYLYPTPDYIARELKIDMEYLWEIYTSTGSSMNRNCIHGSYLYCRGHSLEMGMREECSRPIDDDEITDCLSDISLSFKFFEEPKADVPPLDPEDRFVVGYFHTGLIMEHRALSCWRYTGDIDFDNLFQESEYSLPGFVWDYQEKKVTGKHPLDASACLYENGNRRDHTKNDVDISSFFE